MEKTNLYIKKLIILVLSGFVFYILNNLSDLIIAAPVALLILSFMHAKITAEKPYFLFNTGKADDYLNKKGGFWLLFKAILILVGFVYDLAAWTINGVYVLFLIIIDFLLLIKTIVFWIIHAILWFLKLYVPPLVFLFKMFIHYLLKWPWWIYRLSFRNAGASLNRNFLLISYRGSIVALFLGGFFAGIAILLGVPSISLIGIMFGILPLAWSYAEISSLKMEGREETEFSMVKMKFGKGMETVRAILVYLLIFLVAFIVQLLLNLMGWIPKVGLSLMGLSLNVGTWISLLLVFVFVIIVFSKFLMPAYVVNNRGFGGYANDSRGFLVAIGKKFLRYLAAHIPGSFFAVVLSVIPAVVVGIAIALTLTIKDNVLESRLISLKSEKISQDSFEAIKTAEKIRNIEYLKEFPLNVFRDFSSFNNLRNEISILKQNYAGLGVEIEKTEKLFLEDIESLEQRVASMKSIDTAKVSGVIALERSLDNRKKDFYNWKEQSLEKQYRMNMKIDGKKNMLWQLPVAFLFLVIWISFFGGIVLTFVISYLGSLYHELYLFREDDEPTFFLLTTEELNKKDKNQPLLGFTLLIITVVILYLLFSGNNLSLLETIRIFH